MCAARVPENRHHTLCLPVCLRQRDVVLLCLLKQEDIFIQSYERTSHGALPTFNFETTTVETTCANLDRSNFPKSCGIRCSSMGE